MGNIIFSSQPGSRSGTTVTLPGSYPAILMKISKLGTKYTAYISPDNIIWTKVGTQTDLHFGNNPANIPNYGMAITSGNNAALSTGKIDNFALIISAPLPVRLMDFTAKSVNHDHVLVSWATSMEHLSDQFEIQRSDDNNNFRPIAKVKAAGESETPRYYSFNDNNPVAGINYYRLKEMDRDGKFYLSPVVSVNFNEGPGIEIYPNPAENYTTISSSKDQILDVNVYDVTGKLLQIIHANVGQNTVRLNTSELPKGVYVIRSGRTQALQAKTVRQ